MNARPITLADDSEATPRAHPLHACSRPCIVAEDHWVRRTSLHGKFGGRSGDTDADLATTFGNDRVADAIGAGEFRDLPGGALARNSADSFYLHCLNCRRLSTCILRRSLSS